MVQTQQITPAALTKLADELVKKSDKISAEVFALTYGAFVTHLIHDLDSIQSVNQTLMKVGIQMGYRLIEDFLAQVMSYSVSAAATSSSTASVLGGGGGSSSAAGAAGAILSVGSCKDFRETMEWVTRVGFKLYLNTVPSIRSWSEDSKECVVVFEEGNPLMEFVELPTNLVSSGSLGGSQGQGQGSKDQREQQQDGLVYGNMLCGVIKGALEMVQVQVDVDMLYEDQQECIRVRLVKYLEEEAPPSED